MTDIANPSRSMYMSALFNEAEAAAFLRIEPKTLARWRSARKGPCYVKVGALVRYALPDLEAYFTGSTVRP
jgi:hypothetical protein